MLKKRQAGNGNEGKARVKKVKGEKRNHWSVGCKLRDCDGKLLQASMQLCWHIYFTS